MSRSVLVVGAVVLLGAGIALYFLLGKSSDRAGDGTQATQTGSATSAGGGGGASAGGDRPRLPDGTPIARAGEPGGPPPVAGSANPTGPRVTESDRPRGQGGEGATPGPTAGSAYQVGGVHIRDHRSGDPTSPLDIAPPVHAPGGPRIESTVTNDIGKQVRVTMYECAKTLSRQGRGDKPRVEGQIVTNVKGNVLTVASAIMQPRDLSDADSQLLKSCMEPKLVGLTAPAPNQADLDSYPINVTMSLP